MPHTFMPVRKLTYDPCDNDLNLWGSKYPGQQVYMPTPIILLVKWL